MAIKRIKVIEARLRKLLTRRKWDEPEIDLKVWDEHPQKIEFKGWNNKKNKDEKP